MSSPQLKVSGEILGEDFGVKPGVGGNEQQGGSVSKVTLEQPARGAAHSLKHPGPVSPSVQPVLHLRSAPSIGGSLLRLQPHSILLGLESLTMHYTRSTRLSGGE